MVIFIECQEAVKDFAERFSIQNPKEGDSDALQLFRETVPGASRLTLEFEVESGWTVHIPEIFVDFNLNSNYIFILRGQRFEGDNYAPFTVPQKETEKVTVIIENFSASAQTYSGRIKGWANQR